MWRETDFIHPQLPFEGGAFSIGRSPQVSTALKPPERFALAQLRSQALGVTNRQMGPLNPLLGSHEQCQGIHGATMTPRSFTN